VSGLPFCLQNTEWRVKTYHETKKRALLVSLAVICCDCEVAFIFLRGHSLKSFVVLGDSQENMNLSFFPFYSPLFHIKACSVQKGPNIFSIALLVRTMASLNLLVIMNEFDWLPVCSLFLLLFTMVRNGRDTALTLLMISTTPSWSEINVRYGLSYKFNHEQNPNCTAICRGVGTKKNHCHQGVLSSKTWAMQLIAKSNICQEIWLWCYSSSWDSVCSYSGYHWFSVVDS
jgi:hypothetical protein